MPKTLEEELETDWFTRGFAITVTRTDTEIILTGTVSSHYQKVMENQMALRHAQKENKALLNKIEVP